MDKTGTTGRAEPGQAHARALRFEPARLQLARLNASGVSLRQVWEDLSELVTSALDVDRIGVWVLIDERRALRCRYLYQRSNHQMFHGAVLRAQDFPSYFDAIDARRTIAAAHATSADLTKELREQCCLEGSRQRPRCLVL